jgi:SAM-dependent methyltransferase
MSAAPPNLSDTLHDQAYVASRLHPRLLDPHRLILQDVLAMVRPFAAEVQGKLFDYGSGGGPYRSLFQGIQTYVRADITPGPNVDRILPATGLTEEADGTYDAVLSTQVLEHVPDPEAYLRECRRILRPGGRLLVTTHGMFEEHGCPYDFHRWTARGLENAVAAAGFEVKESVKLTAGPRGAVQLYHYLIGALHAPQQPVWHALFALVRRLHAVTGLPLLNALASVFTRFGVVPALDPAAVYVGVAVSARKP